MSEEESTNIWANGRPIMEDGKPMTWIERVRIEKGPEAPDWLVWWAETMDNLDGIEWSLDKMIQESRESRRNV